MASETPFGERLRVLREAAGLSMYALAKLSGVTGQAIANIEQGRSDPVWTTVRKLARGLGVSVAVFEAAEQAPAVEPVPDEQPGRAMGKRK